ncbi:MAG: hypothetical protein JKY65_02640 [Planctomycetes bacterium]|nr:hypothetical protein [Planctomycetota bacterium]
MLARICPTLAPVSRAPNLAAPDLAREAGVADRVFDPIGAQAQDHSQEENL